MQNEIEAKFLHISHDVMRQVLKNAGATCTVPMRDMRRSILDFPDRRLHQSNSFVRVRDEGDKVTMTFKRFEDQGVNGAREVETLVGSYEQALNICLAIGLVVQSSQESKRETWLIDGVEVVLDEWPWLDPLIEIEGPSEAEVKRTSYRLGLDWQSAVFGDATVAYRAQYPHLSDEDNIVQIPQLVFGGQLPELLQNKL